MCEFTVLVVSRNGLFRSGLKSVLESSAFSVIAEADGTSAITAASGADIEPDIILVDRFGDADGMDRAIASIRARRQDAKIVVVAETLSREALTACLAAGASGYLISDISTAALLESLKLVALGETVFPTCLGDLLYPGIPSSGRQACNCGLSRREVDILARLVRGDTNKQIAQRFRISEATVKVHMRRLLPKIGARNRTQAAVWARRNLA
ncbi:MAG: LuxR C-terminal-related transcriptional regulator [Alphaproteobacteria bacterium]